MQYHAIPCNTLQYHAIPCNIMQYHVKPFNIVQNNAIPCNTMQYHAKSCNTMQYHVAPCNTMQYPALPCIIDNCWRSVKLPCGQYKAIFIFVFMSMFFVYMFVCVHYWRPPPWGVCAQRGDRVLTDGQPETDRRRLGGGSIYLLGTLYWHLPLLLLPHLYLGRVQSAPKKLGWDVHKVPPRVVTTTMAMLSWGLTLSKRRNPSLFLH